MATSAERKARAEIIWKQRHEAREKRIQTAKETLDRLIARHQEILPLNRPVFLGQMVECIHAAAPVPRRS